MKKLFLLLTLMTFSLNALAAGTASKNRLSWSLLYGYSKNNNELDYAPAGAAYKFMFGGRLTNFDMHIFLRYLDSEGDVTYQNTQGTITHNNLTAGAQVGFWPLSFLNLHFGYAEHSISEKLEGSFITAQRTAITSQYKVDDRKTGGLFYGGDLVILQTTNFQLFANYDNYRLNGLSANEWEVLGGLRFYYDASGSNSGGEGNWFTKMFTKMFKPAN